MNLGKLLREPLVHFFAVGAAMFMLYGWLNRDAPPAPDEIVVDEARVEQLVAQFERLWMRPPTRTELQGLVDNWVRQEVLYREGLALGLDQDDPVISRRIAQKMTFISEGLADSEPTEAELQAWLDEHPEQYAFEPRFSFRQLFFDAEQHDAPLEDIVASALGEIESGADASTLGDPTLLPFEIDNAPLGRVESTFGDGFAERLGTLTPGEWTAAVLSAYGSHLVIVDEVMPGRAATLDEVRAEVERDLAASKREQADDAFYNALKARYTVRLPDGLLVEAGASGAGAN